MRKEIHSDYAVILNVDDGTFTELAFLEPYALLKASPDLSVISQERYIRGGYLHDFYTRGGDLLLSTRPEGGGHVQCISSNNEYAVFHREASFDLKSFRVIEIATGKVTHGQTGDSRDSGGFDPDGPPSALSVRYLGDWFQGVGERQFWTAFKNTQETN